MLHSLIMPINNFMNDFIFYCCSNPIHYYFTSSADHSEAKLTCNYDSIQSVKAMPPVPDTFDNKGFFSVERNTRHSLKIAPLPFLGPFKVEHLSADHLLPTIGTVSVVKVKTFPPLYFVWQSSLFAFINMWDKTKVWTKHDLLLVSGFSSNYRYFYDCTFSAVAHWFLAICLIKVGSSCRTKLML